MQTEKKQGKSVIGNQMSKILADLEEDDGSTHKLSGTSAHIKHN